MPIIRDDDGKRYKVEYSDNGGILSQWEHWTLTEKINALRSLFGKDAIRYADRYRWVHDYHYRPGSPGGKWEVIETCPESIDYSEVHPVRGENTRVFVDLSRIGKGEDYYSQSSTLDRSNFRRLIADFPGEFTAVSYSNVDALGAYVGNLAVSTIDVLKGLVDDYPAYDDEDMSQLEHDEICESYEYSVSDITSGLDSEHQDMWEALSRVKLPAYTANETDIPERDAQPDLFWDAYQSNGGNDYAEHRGVEVVWDHKAMAAALTRTLDAYFAQVPSDPDQLTLFAADASASTGDQS
jgi:hypothetical protein